jgi:hypothetical protein
VKVTFVNGRLAIVGRYREERTGSVVDGGARVELLRRCGGEDLLPGIDLEERRRALPAILMAINTCLARLPSSITTYSGTRVATATAVPG